LSTLYIRLPSKAAADGMPNWLAMACPFALISKSGVIERDGIAPLSELSDTTAQIKSIALLLAASDVTLLRMQTPPLSPAKLKAALPNLVEEQLLFDPSDCVIVAGKLNDGKHTIAVAQRTWLDLLAKTFISFGARNIVALPAQSCLSSATKLPTQADIVTIAINQHDICADLTLRLAEHEGIGLTIMPAPEQTDRYEPDEATAREVIQTLSSVVPIAPIKMYIHQHSIHAYQILLANTPTLQERITVSTDNWTHWMAGFQNNALDLMSGIATSNRPKLDWLSWRWPLVLGAVILIINIGALNIEWWHMESEADSMRSAMIDVYKSTFPKETVIVDPLAQMQQKIAIAEHGSGKAADFSIIAATFGEVWSNITAGLTPHTAIASLEYRDHSLLVSLKSATNQPGQFDFSQNDEALAGQMKVELAKRNLTLEPATNQSGTQAWKIRRTR